MHTYLNLLEDVLDNGKRKYDRTGVGTRSVFGREARFRLQEGFPLLTTKRLHLPSIVAELLWMLSGDTNVRALQAQGVTIWDEWADRSGDLGPIYGQQWRAWRGGRLGWGTIFDRKKHDQIADVIKSIETAPNSRRHIVSAWNVADIKKMALPPCHMSFQLYVLDGKLSCKVTQRSGDLFLGVPFNIASYALLTHLLARHTGLIADELIMSFGDLHLYDNHISQAMLQLTRKPKHRPYLSFMVRNTDLFEMRAEDICFMAYDPHPNIPAPVAV